MPDYKIKLTLELSEDEYERYFKIPKDDFKEKTSKYRTNSDIFRDIVAENEQNRQLSLDKSQKIDLLFTENAQLKRDIKKYVESLKMTCPECGYQGMGIKLDWSIIAGWEDK